jgi:hypothetical protein
VTIFITSKEQVVVIDECEDLSSGPLLFMVFPLDLSRTRNTFQLLHGVQHKNTFQAGFEPLSDYDALVICADKSSYRLCMWNSEASEQMTYERLHDYGTIIRTTCI